MAKDRDDDAAPKPRSDAYVGLLGITLAAVLGGAVLMVLDHGKIDEGAKGVQPPVANSSPDGLEYKAPGKQ